MTTSASVIITARDPGRLYRAGLELGASVAAFDATDLERLARFFAELPSPINHLVVSEQALTTRRSPNWMPRRHAATSIRNCRCHCKLPATRRANSSPGPRCP